MGEYKVGEGHPFSLLKIRRSEFRLSAFFPIPENLQWSISGTLAVSEGAF